MRRNQLRDTKRPSSLKSMFSLKGKPFQSVPAIVDDGGEEEDEDEDEDEGKSVTGQAAGSAAELREVGQAENRARLHREMQTIRLKKLFHCTARKKNPRLHDENRRA